VNSTGFGGPRKLGPPYDLLPRNQVRASTHPKDLWHFAGIFAIAVT